MFFMSITFFKHKFQATLDPLLLLVVDMCNQKFFTLTNFPSIVTFDVWIGIDECYGVLV
jgi:hypothetical protein